MEIETVKQLNSFFERFLVRNNKLEVRNSYDCNDDDNLSTFRDEYIQHVTYSSNF